MERYVDIDSAVRALVAADNTEARNISAELAASGDGAIKQLASQLSHVPAHVACRILAIMYQALPLPPGVASRLLLCLSSVGTGVADWAEWTLSRVSPEELERLSPSISQSPRLISVYGHSPDMSDIIKRQLIATFAEATPKAQLLILRAMSRQTLIFAEAISLTEAAVRTRTSRHIQAAIGLLSLAAIRWRRGSCPRPTNAEVARSLSLLTNLIDDVDEWITRRSIYAAIEFNVMDPELIRVLQKCSESLVPETRRAAVSALCVLSEDTSTTEILVRRLSDSELDVALAAAVGLSQRNISEVSLVRALQPFLVSPDPARQSVALTALVERDETPSTLGIYLYELLLKNDPIVADLVCRALGGLAILNPQMRSILAANVAQGQSHIRASALRALGRHTTNAEDIARGLSTSFSSTDEHLHEVAARLLLELSVAGIFKRREVLSDNQVEALLALAETRRRLLMLD